MDWHVEVDREGIKIILFLAEMSANGERAQPLFCSIFSSSEYTEEEKILFYCKVVLSPNLTL